MMVKFNGTTSSTWRRSPRNPGCESLNTWSSAMIMLIVCNQTKDINMWMILQSQNSYLSLPVLEISHPTTVSSMCHQIQEPTNFIFINLIYTQNHVDTISEWTRINKMMHNSAKSNYMIFNMRYGSLCTRLNLESNIFEKVSATKRLGVWISEDLDWELNTLELCKKAYSRISLLCKLKYVGLSTQDLLKTYISFIRCLLEYACVVWHSTLTVNQTCALERVQKTCL